MDIISIGIIGIGNMGSAHTLSISKGLVPGLKLVAVADRKETRRQWAVENLPEDCRVFKEGTELIESGLCDAVLIATPHYQHPPLTVQALEAGLHVMCEKPVGVDAADIQGMCDAADRSGKVFALMFNQRTNALYRRLKQMVDEGELGAIKRMNWIITDWYRTQIYYDSGDWRATWAGEGGVLINQCPHQLDLLQWICGMPERVHAFCHYGKWHDIEVEDDVTAYLEFPNGATGVFITSTGDAPGTNRLEITGELGKIVCENNTLTFWKLDQNEREFCKSARGGFDTPALTRIEVETDGLNEQHIGVLKAFAGHILQGTPLIARGSEGIRGLTLSNAMHLSGWLGQTVSIPFDKALFSAELDKRRKASRLKTGGVDAVFDTSGSY